MSKKKPPQIPEKKDVSLVRSSAAEYLTFVAATGGGGVEAVYADESIWLTQKMLAQLYDVDVRTINYHLKKVFSDSELQAESVIRNFRITASDGKSYNTQHYKLPAIIAVGYKVNSERAVQFRKWATGIIEQFTIKAYVMDDERIKAGGSNAYLDVAEDMAQRKIPLTMQDWETRLNRFIEATDREVLQDAGKVTAEIAKAHAESEFEKYRIVQDRLFESDFDRMLKQIEAASPPDSDSDSDKE
ncbi:MAG: virulence RhuM family protein [Pseudomonadota bacterium]